MALVTRDELYSLVWSEPMIRIGERLGVSGSYLARVCALLNVPRPERGYWAKLEVGKAPPVPPLLDPRPGDPLCWQTDGEQAPAPKPKAPARRKADAKPVRIARDWVHSLIRQARPLFEKGYPIEEGAHLKPYKRLMVDVTTTHACLDKALALANDLFNAFESGGHRVVIAASDGGLVRDHIESREEGGKPREGWEHRGLWSPGRPTVVYVGTVAIGLAVIEMSEHIRLRYVGGKYVRESEYRPSAAHRLNHHHSWTTTRDVPSGRLRVVAYAPYGSISWSKQWQEGKASLAPTLLKSIVEQVEAAAPKLVEMLEEAGRLGKIARQKAEAERERWLRQEDLRRVNQSIAESRAQLSDVIKRWSDLVSVEQFLAGVETRASALAEEEQAGIRERLHAARELLGSQDPLDFIRNWQTPSERYRPRYDAVEGANRV